MLPDSPHTTLDDHPASEPHASSAATNDSAGQPPAEGQAAGAEDGATGGSTLVERLRSRMAARQSNLKSDDTEPASPDAPAPAANSATAPDVASEPAQPVPVPTVRAPLPPDLDREVEEALSDASLDQMLDMSVAGGTPDIEIDSRVRAIVVRIERDNVFFSLGGRHEGVVSVRQFREPPKGGSHYDVLVTGFNTEDKLYELTIPGGAVDVGDWTDLVEGTVVEARVTGANTGGLECKVHTIRGFIPISQIAEYHVDNLADFIDKKLLCVVTEANRKRRNLVLSHRAILEREREDRRKEFLEKLEVGEICEGVVRSLRDFGAFVDLGGVDGLIHISQLSWDRVNHPKEVLEEGQKVRVRVEKVDAQSGKIGLSLRSLTEHPWHDIERRYAPSSVVRGTVTRLAKFGAFVKIAQGVEGLIHISELSHQRVARVSDVLKEGQEVEVKILSVDAENQRIALSIRAILPEPEQPEAQESGAPTRELAATRRKVPLRGGMDRPSGGEQFGLRW